MARMKGPKKTNRYPDEFKIKAVQLADHPDILAECLIENTQIRLDNNCPKCSALNSDISVL